MRTVLIVNSAYLFLLGLIQLFFPESIFSVASTEAIYIKSLGFATITFAVLGLIMLTVPTFEIRVAGSSVIAMFHAGMAVSQGYSASIGAVTIIIPIMHSLLAILFGFYLMSTKDKTI